MHDLSLIAPSCGVLLGQDAQGRFEHVATAWCVETNEWVTAWAGEEPPKRLQLLSADGVRAGEIGNWELDHGIAGFTAATPGINPLPVHRDQTLRKRDRLWALGYPSMIDHPAFRLHRGSLDPERYLPYLCPWTLSGHLALFSADDGYLTGRCYDGMGGGPVFDDTGVVGVLLDGIPAPDHPPLARFRRLA